MIQIFATDLHFEYGKYPFAFRGTPGITRILLYIFYAKYLLCRVSQFQSKLISHDHSMLYRYLSIPINKDTVYFHVLLLPPLSIKHCFVHALSVATLLTSVCLAKSIRKIDL
jgi:hypothetical protein